MSVMSIMGDTIVSCTEMEEEEQVVIWRMRGETTVLFSMYFKSIQSISF